MSTEAWSDTEPVRAGIERRPARSVGARTLGPIMRVTARPILDLTPLTTRTLARLHLFDVLGNFLPLPAGATVGTRYYRGFDAELVTGAGVTASRDSAVLYFHGGGFITCGLRTHRRLVARVSSAAGIPVLQVNYRQLPTAKLSQTVEDCLLAYRTLLDDGYDADRIVFAGDSAGGYLAFATALRAIADGLPRPAGIVGLSPWVDLMCEHSATHRNARRDAYLPVKKLARVASLLGDENDPLSSIFEAELAALPPVLIQVGSGEVLRSDAELLASALTAAGVPNTLQIWDRQIHVFQAAADIVPEGHAAIGDIGAFVQAAIKNSRPSTHPSWCARLAGRNSK